MELVKDLVANQPILIDTIEGAKDLFKRDQKNLLHCLTTVLL